MKVNYEGKFWPSKKATPNFPHLLGGKCALFAEFLLQLNNQTAGRFKTHFKSYLKVLVGRGLHDFEDWLVNMLSFLLIALNSCPWKIPCSMCAFSLFLRLHLLRFQTFTTYFLLTALQWEHLTTEKEACSSITEKFLLLLLEPRLQPHRLVA